MVGPSGGRDHAHCGPGDFPRSRLRGPRGCPVVPGSYRRPGVYPPIGRPASPFRRASLAAGPTSISARPLLRRGPSSRPAAPTRSSVAARSPRCRLVARCVANLHRLLRTECPHNVTLGGNNHYTALGDPSTMTVEVEWATSAPTPTHYFLVRWDRDDADPNLEEQHKDGAQQVRVYKGGTKGSVPIVRESAHDVSDLCRGLRDRQGVPRRAGRIRSGSMSRPSSYPTPCPSGPYSSLSCSTSRSRRTASISSRVTCGPSVTGIARSPLINGESGQLQGGAALDAPADRA